MRVLPASRAGPVPVPRWATFAAIAIPLCVLPSAIWRAWHGLDVIASGPGRCGVQSEGEAIYVVSLSAVSLGVALLSFALVCPWGEVVPRAAPWLGGKRIPTLLVAVAAAAAASAIGLLTVYFLAKEAFGLGGIVESRELAPGCSKPGIGILVYYVPLVAWAPLLYALTYHYWRRRVGQGSSM